MAQKNSSPWVDYVIFGLTVFLIFCLIFESFIDLPGLVAWLGRWHPLILHFPIVLLLMSAALGLFNRMVPKLLLIIATISALVTAITGFFLGNESVPKGDLLMWHQWMGAGVAILAVLWYWLGTNHLQQTYLVKGIQVVLIVLVGLTGHYGGMITHGEDFLTFPKSKKLEKIPEDPLIYEHIVHRILDNNCIGCHNPNKKKGELLMTGIDELVQGGESGPALVIGDPGKSEIVRRLHLPKEDEEHMPPEGKKPLSENEIQILERWIALGASDTLKWSHLDRSEPLAGMVKKMMDSGTKNSWAKLPKVADSTLQNLASDYVTIKRIASNSQALGISVYLPPEYDPKNITDLKRIANNIVELDLSGIPIGEKEMEFVAMCKNLEWLEVDRTPITDAEFVKLTGLINLKVLKAYETGITDESVVVMRDFKNLNSLYVWETQLSDLGLSKLREAIPNLHIDYGINPELKTEFIGKDTIVDSIQ
ncbi:MAG: c-type cytochrome domain-containing protein [Flavobacteriaceae bacterium]